MKLNSIDLNKISIFCQVIDAGNYQRASEVLHVTPSALSQTISHLESSLGLPLFNRQGRKLIPTREGLRIHQEFKQRHQGFVQVLKSMQQDQLEVSGTLRLGAYLEFAKSRLTPLLKSFLQENPFANIKMTFDSPTRLQKLLDRGQLDLCLSIFPSGEKKTVRSKVLCKQELVLIAPPGILSDSPKIADVLNTPIIDYFYNHQPIARWISLHYGKRPKKIPVRFFAATAEMVMAMVREGAGIGVVPKYLLSTPESSKGLKIIRPTPERLNDYVWFLERAALERSTLHTVFRTRLLEHF